MRSLKWPKVWSALIWLACAKAGLAGPPAKLQAAPAARPPDIRVQEIRHGQGDRLVVFLPPTQAVSVHQAGDTLVLALPPGLQMLPLGKPAYGFGAWITGVAQAGAELRISLAPGAHPRVRKLWNRVWIDADSTSPKLVQGQFIPDQAAPLPLPAPAPLPPPKPAASQASGGVPAAGSAGGGDKPAAPPEWPVPAPAGVAPPAAPAAPVTLLTDTSLYGGPSILLQVEHAAAAAFTRGTELHVVLDSAAPMDLSALKDDPSFGSAREHLLADGAELILRVPQGAQPRLAQQSGLWVLTLAEGPAVLAAIEGRVAKHKLLFAASRPGHVVVVEDEATGGRLLVGTQHMPGQHMPASHGSPEFTVLPSWQGIAIEPRSDRVSLHDVEAGFELTSTEAPDLAAVWPDGLAGLRADGAAMTRRFDMPALSPAILRRRLAEALRDAALAPRTGRTAPRVRVAQAMLAAGLDREAEAALQVAEADDPASAADTTLQGLASIAAWMSARAGGSALPRPSLDPARLGDTDEAMMWRALWSADTDPAGAAAKLAARWPLLLNYPEGLRRPILPAVAEALGAGGQGAALDRFLAAFPGPELDLARASQLARQGKVPASLAILDRLQAGRDRLVRAQAQEAAVEQRLAARMLDKAQAAALLEHSLYAWRGGDRELRVRLRAAQLRAQSGGWRQALAMLRETEPLFPAAAPTLHEAQVAVVSGLMHSDRAAQLNALDLVALADEASRLLSPADADATLAPLLADRLAGLDLPGRAAPILRRLMASAPEGDPRARIGLRLAGLLAEEASATKALSVLAESQAGTIDPKLAEARGVLRARLLADSGHTQEATIALASLASPAALDLLATLQEHAKDWPAAERSLRSLLEDAAFSTQAIQTRRDMVLRAVRDASQASDMPALQAWRARFAPLFAGAREAGLFDILTAEPVQRVSDLARAGHELGTIRALPAALAVASARP